MTARREGPRPPRLAEKLLELMVGSGACGRTILGDAREELTARGRTGRWPGPALWYWSYVLRFALTYGFGRDRRPSGGLSLGTGIRHAARGLVRRPGFALAVVVTLALGLGATTLAFAMVDGVLLRPLPYDAPEELVHVSRLDPEWFGGTVDAQRASGTYATPPATFFDWERRSRAFSSLGAFGGGSMSLQEGDEPVRISGAVVTSGLFAALGVPAAVGRTLLEEDDVLGADPVMVLSHGLWLRYFGGDSGIVGRAISADGTSFTVVGVMPADFAFPSQGTDFWVPFGDGLLLSERRSAGFLHAVGRLAPGVTLEEARADMRRVTAEMGAVHEVERDFETFVFPLREITVARARSGLLLLLGAALAVLLVGAANVTNLLLSRSAERRREFAVHAALGAGSGRLAGLVLGESLFLSGVGAVLGGLLAWLSLGPFLGALPMTVPRAAEIAIDGRVVLVAAALTLALAVAVALLPAFHTGRTELGATLRHGGQGSAGGRQGFRSHGALVVAEVALAVLILSASGTFVESYRLSVSRDLGFGLDGATAFFVNVPALRESGPDERRLLFDDLMGRLEGIPGVETLALASQMPLGGGFSSPPAGVETGEGVEETIIHSSVVSTRYFEAMDIPLLAGRVFDAGDTEGTTPVAVVSQALARRYWPGEDPLGKRVRIGSEEDGVWHQVVGMVGSVRYSFAGSEVVEYYRAADQWPMPQGNVILETVPGSGDVGAAAAAVVREILPTVPISVQSLSQRFRTDRNNRWARLASILLAGLGGTAVLLAIVGIYSVLSYAVVRRTRDIGIRVSLGGTRVEILREVLGDFLLLAGIGVMVGLGMAVATGSMVRSALVGVAPTGPWILAGVSAVVLLTVLVASLVPAVRALRVDPLVAFRTD